MKWLSLAVVFVAVAASALADGTVETRFGTLSIVKVEEGLLETVSFNGKKLFENEGSAVEVIETLHARKKDFIILAMYSGGSGCPAQAAIVEIRSAKDVELSPSFGSCTDLITARMRDGKVVVEMPDFIAHPDLADPKDVEKVERTIKVYTWSSGKLRETSRPK